MKMFFKFVWFVSLQLSFHFYLKIIYYFRHLLDKNKSSLYCEMYVSLSEKFNRIVK